MPNSSDQLDIQKMRLQLDYLLLEVSRLRSIIRYLSARRINDFPLQLKTKASFDYQWANTRDGNWVETRPELKEREPGLVLSYTRLPREWFAGKRVLDAGCGSGRFSWALASLGANVVAVDQSTSGVLHTERACREFGDRVRVFQHDLSKPLPLEADFDLVWSFGVLHHTGDTYGAFSNIAQLVRPGSYLFMMIYAEPTDDPGAFEYYANVERLRREVAAMNFDERYAFFEKTKGAEAGGWFDAVSPDINDTYPLHELKVWLSNAGFVDAERTMDHPNHHLIARKQPR